MLVAVFVAWLGIWLSPVSLSWLSVDEFINVELI